MTCPALKRRLYAHRDGSFATVRVGRFSTTRRGSVYTARPDARWDWLADHANDDWRIVLLDGGVDAGVMFADDADAVMFACAWG